MAFKRFYLTVFFLGLLVKGFATHIIGGSLTYTFNGGTNYTIKLLLYRDCSNPTNFAFPNNVVISAISNFGTNTQNITLAASANIINIPAVLPPCASLPATSVCAQERAYTATVNLTPSAGGIHLFYDIGNRNNTIGNIVNPGAIGETFYAYIPCYLDAWTEVFDLPNGTTIDNGSTAWTRTVTGTAPMPTASVNNGQFSVTAQNSGQPSVVNFQTQVIPINLFTNGVNLNVIYSEPPGGGGGGTLENDDSIKVFYSLNGGPKTLFSVNGQQFNDFNATISAAQNGLIGNTIWCKLSK
jgi:hypothetical protein